MFSHVFTFFPSAFSKHIFSQFVQVHFQNTFFHFFILFYFFLSVKNAGEMRFENALGKNVKKCGLKM
jgi:hypothetical protein